MSSLLSLPNDHIMQARAAGAVLIHTICRDWTKHFPDKDFIRDLMTEINGCPRGNHSNNRIRRRSGARRDGAGGGREEQPQLAVWSVRAPLREGPASLAPGKNRCRCAVWGSRSVSVQSRGGSLTTGPVTVWAELCPPPGKDIGSSQWFHLV